MNRCARVFWPAAALVALCLAAVPSGVQADKTEEPLFDGIVKQKGIEIMKQGPVHEAFAQPGTTSPAPMPPVAKQPPAPVPEMPPEQKPKGDNVQWIPGYWAWDSDKNDFIWVSGLYRNTPPGRKYVPGYWAQTAEGWRWVPGFYTPEQQPDVTYVPQPPATLDNGPNVPPPDDSSFYTQGTWVYNGTEFVWRPGFWAPYRPGYVWVDAAYQWTPGGYVFIPGYWDYPLANRGLLFPPVYFSSPLYQQPGYYYTPNYALGLGNLLNYLFYRPYYPSYYYGGYYGPGYAGLGYRPWYYGPGWGNSLYNYYRWANRGNPGWFNGVRQAYAGGPHNVQFASLNRMNGLVGVPSGQVAGFRTHANQLQQAALNRSRLENGMARQGTMRGTGAISPTTFSPKTFTAGTARLNTAAHPPTNKQGLTGRMPGAVTQQPFRSTVLSGAGLNTGGYHPGTGIVGSPRNSTVTHSIYPGNGAASAYRATPNYRPATTYHAPAYHAPAYHAPAAHYGGGHMGGGHSGGGHTGGGHGGGHGGHR